MCFACWHLTDSNIQKLKQQYNQSGGPALEITLAEVQQDLQIHPPQVLTLEDVELTNGTANGHMEQVPGSGKTVQHIQHNTEFAAFDSTIRFI